MSGYITEEKLEIAKRHLIPKELANTGLNSLSKKITFPKATLEMIIEKYTRESGVRQLEKQIGKVMRKVAFKYEIDGDLAYNNSHQITLKNYLEKLHLAEIFTKETNMLAL